MLFLSGMSASCQLIIIILSFMFSRRIFYSSCNSNSGNTLDNALNANRIFAVLFYIHKSVFIISIFFSYKLLREYENTVASQKAEKYNVKCQHQFRRNRNPPLKHFTCLVPGL